MQNIEKVLRSLITNFDYIVVYIKESQNPTKMKLEELQASPDAHDMRLKQRNSKREKVTEHALQTRFIKRFRKEREKQRKNLTNDEKSRKNSKNHYDLTKKVTRNKYSGKNNNMKEV